MPAHRREAECADVGERDCRALVAELGAPGYERPAAPAVVTVIVGADEQTIGRLVGNIAQLRVDPKSRAKLRDPRIAHFKVGDPIKIDVLTYAPGLQIEEALKTAEVVEVEGVALLLAGS